MTAIQIHDEQLARRLQALSERENRLLKDILRTRLDQYLIHNEPLASMEEMFEDDITNLSTSVRGTMTTFYHQR